MKFLCICQSGLGSSFMVQMNIQNLLNSEGVTEEISVEHADVGSTTADMADYFFVEKRWATRYPACRGIALSCSTA